MLWFNGFYWSHIVWWFCRLSNLSLEDVCSWDNYISYIELCVGAILQIFEFYHHWQNFENVDSIFFLDFFLEAFLEKFVETVLTLCSKVWSLWLNLLEPEYPWHLLKQIRNISENGRLEMNETYWYILIELILVMFLGSFINHVAW